MLLIKREGWANIHIATDTKELYISGHPYATEAEAETGIFIGAGIQKVACIKIEWEEELKMFG